MLNEPRVYRHSPFQIGLVVLVFGILGILLFGTISQTDYLVSILFLGFLGIIFLLALYPMTKKAIISDNEISTQTILGSKSLAWNEISGISGSGYAIKLHNLNGDVTIAPSPQLPGYEEIVELIGLKRPDLFNPLDYSEMSKSVVGIIVPPVISLLLIGFGFLLFMESGFEVIPFWILPIVGIIFMGIMLTSPKGVTIQGNSIVISYFFSQKTLPADEVASIDLSFTQTRNGKSYFIAITLTNKKVIRIPRTSNLSPNLPVVYLVLKNWHKKNTTSGNSFGRF